MNLESEAIAIIKIKVQSTTLPQQNSVETTVAFKATDCDFNLFNQNIQPVELVQPLNHPVVSLYLQVIYFIFQG